MKDEENEDGLEPDESDDQTKKKSGNDEDEDPVVSMSQAKYDKMLAGKAKQGKRAATNDLLKSLDVESIDELKTILEAKAEAEEAEKSDGEKLQSAHDDAKGKLDAALDKVKSLEAQVIADAVRNALIHQARAAGAQHPEDVAAMALTLPGEFEAYADDQIDPDVIEEMVETVKKQREGWFGEAQAPQGNPPHDKGRAPNEDDQKSTKDALAKMLQRTKDHF